MTRARLAAVLLLLPAAAHARDCVAQDQIAMTALAVGDSQVELVPVTVNGAQTQFLLDTGGGATQISAELAARLNLPVNRSSDALVDVSGRAVAGLVMLRQFQLGAHKSSDVPMALSPNSVVGTGLLALDDLAAQDVEMDFSAGALKLFAPDSCSGPAWSTSSLPIRLANGHVTLTVKLDGKDIPAILDTGATGTNLRADTATQFGATPGAADTPENGELDGGLPTYGHVFQSLALGGVMLDKPRITILPDKADRGGRSVTLGGPELILGMDVLRTLHLYFAFTAGRLYLAQTPPH